MTAHHTTLYEPLRSTDRLNFADESACHGPLASRISTPLLLRKMTYELLAIALPISVVILMEIFGQVVQRLMINTSEHK